MSSGVDSEQSSGGRNSQISMENYEYGDKLKKIQDEETKLNLTDAQRSTLNIVTNTVVNHLTDMDYSGVKRDLRGDMVPNGRGGYFDHVHEMKDSYRALIKSRRSLEGSLKNPKLGYDERTLLEKTLKTVNDHIGKIDKMFKPFGGIDKWRKK